MFALYVAEHFVKVLLNFTKRFRNETLEFFSTPTCKGMGPAIYTLGLSPLGLNNFGRSQVTNTKLTGENPQ